MAVTSDRTVGRPKRPSEEWRVSWDFVDDIEIGDTPSTQQVSAIQVDTGSDVSATFLQGAGITGTVIKVQVQGGTDGKDYLVTFQLTTTQGDVFRRTVLVQVRA